MNDSKLFLWNDRKMQRGLQLAEENMDAAGGTYSGFVGVVKFATIITIIITAFVIFLISA